jgi:hypothetical protein
MHFEIWWVFAFALTMTGIQSVTKIIVAALQKNKNSSLPPRALTEMNEKIERISQAVEATAIEVERIGESQRFLTRLMSEQPLTQIGRESNSLTS